jgi:1-phosphofructokinase family hexose kinase
MPKILAVCLNPTDQRTVRLERLDKGEVNRAVESRLDASGKGVNVGRVLLQLGAEVRHLTHLGPGRGEFLRLCAADGLEVVWAESDSPIRTCTTLLDPTDGSTTEIIEPTGPVDETCVAAIQAAFTEHLAWADWVVLSGSKAPGYPKDLFADFCREAAAAGKPVAADYRGEELIASLPERPALVKINLVEFCATFLPGLEVSEADDSAALPAARKKLAELSSEGMDFVITRGAREILCAHQGEISAIAPRRITPVNTIGSGDAATAGMVFSLASGADLTSAAAEGARCGAANAALLKPGTII